MSDSFPSNSNNLNIDCSVTIINSEFNSEIVNQLISTTEDRLKEISNVNISKISVPGAYEIPFIVKKIIEQKSTDAIICLGAIIRGETTHYDLISENVFTSISDLNNLGTLPIINGILTTENINQAKERIKNGIYFADTCIHMIKLNKDLT
tara:strand:+ start:32 stop:484 length:453 start_codon:yes stop_codon:yes gene_type:complete